MNILITSWMPQTLDKHNHSTTMLQSPSLWFDPSAPTTMDFCHEANYCSLTPSGYSTFPSVLTLSELDIDSSAHRIFEGLPEIFEDSLFRDEVAKPAVVSTSFPSNPPTQGIRPSSMSISGSASQVLPLQPTSLVTATAAIAPESLIFKSNPQESRPATLADRKEGKPRKVRGRAKGSTPLPDSKLPGIQTPFSNALEAIPIGQTLPLPSATACVIPKILPSTLTAVSLSTLRANQHASCHPDGLGPQVDTRLLKRTRKDLSIACNTRTQKTQHFDKVEHIVRERWRRDDMAGKFLTLEALLPPSSKRDRSTIVEDSMKLVKSLQHRKEVAMKRRSELKMAVSYAGHSPHIKLNNIIQKIGSLTVIQHSQPLESTSPSSSSMVPFSGRNNVKRGSSEGDKLLELSENVVVPKHLRDCVKRFQIQSELFNESIVIEMICEQIPNFHSTLLRALESLGLEVTRCSITNTINKLICNITVKPYLLPASGRRSSTSVMEGLNSAFRTI